MNATTNGNFQPTPGDGWIPGCFMENRNKFTREQLAPHAGRFAAFSLDGTRIIASANGIGELCRHLDEQGIPSTQYVVEWVDDAESFWSYR